MERKDLDYTAVKHLEVLRKCEDCGYPDITVVKRDDDEYLCDDCYKDRDYLYS